MAAGVSPEIVAHAGRSPGFGQTPGQRAMRDCKEETGIDTELTGILGVFSDPAHIVA
jgi:ADP-ribose pyrophosphatase YjhB (NUDIX family)